MFVISYLFALLAGFLRIGITTIKTNPDPVTGTSPAGALVDAASLITQLGAIQANGSPAFGNWSGSLIASSLAAATYNGNQVVGGIIKRFAPSGAAYTDCTDTATNIVNAIPGAKVNQTFPLIIANLGSAATAQTLTLGAGTGVTITGTATVASNCFALFLGQVTGSAAVTITRMFQVGGSGNIVTAL